MERYLVVLTAMLLINSYVFSEEMKFANIPLKNEEATVKRDYSKKDCIMMKYGKMMQMKDGYINIISSDTTMPNGTKVMNDGTCVLKGGKKMTMMKEGDCMDMNGNMMRRTG